MLEIIIVSLFTIFLHWIIKKTIEKRILRSLSAKESVKIRKLYRTIRGILLALYVVVIVIELGVFSVNLFSNLSSSGLIMNRFFIFIGVIAFATLPISAMSLPISGMTIDQMDEKEFCLFLRGFSSDDYNPSLTEKVEKTYSSLHGAPGKSKKQSAEVEKMPFSEKAFSSAIKSLLPIYSVGMPKELESPEGSERIYLDDETWQEKVTYLIDKAKYVFVLVHNSKSCLWEIQQCQKLANEKTVFFIDDPNSLKELCNSNQEGIPRELVDLVDNDLSIRHTMVYTKNGAAKTFHYQNDEEGFRKALDVFFKDLGWNFQEENNRAQYEKDRTEIERDEIERKEKERIERVRLRQERRKNKRVSAKTRWIPWVVISVGVLALALLLIFAIPKKINHGCSGSYNGHEYVDLGLPSGTLWATCNVGASKPEDYGDYYAWGEIQTKSCYDWDWDTYKYANGSKDKLTKYCDKSYNGNNGFTDNLTSLLYEDDAATANWGNGWCTPSNERWDELLQNTTNIWTTRNGVKGRLFSSKKNGMSIFLPAAGHRWISKLMDAGSDGYYWSRSLDAVRPYYAWRLYFCSDDCNTCGSLDRYNGLSVRPVREK